ncbi:hypothetical protein PV328_004164 [Microctonus aethiopoides]|uniref:DDE Tnp4 domain-containing protein n=1 Tax=Microctonus aethiopoides TaxID=144406 RepID=A0AA39F9X9_9HYME|nr:hypothetical protein PV328_004164 [Microctonus aethiopoides]
MECACKRGEQKAYLIGDSRYPLKPAKNCIERLVGLLKDNRKNLSQHRVSQYELGFAGRIVNACAVVMWNAEGILHNKHFGDFFLWRACVWGQQY